MKRALSLIDEYAEYTLIVVFYGYFVTIIVVEIVLRYVFNTSTGIGEETARHAFIWLSWFAASLAVKKRIHISIRLIMDFIPQRAQHVLNFFYNVLFLIVCTAVLYYLSRLMETQYTYGTVSRAARYPMYMAYAGVALGYLMMIVRLLQNMVQDFKDFRSDRALRAGDAIF